MTELKAPAVGAETERANRSALMRWPKLPLRSMVGLAVLVGLFLAAYWAPLPQNPTQPHPLDVLRPPSHTFWFGTDSSGFDVFSRTIVSARIDLPLAVGGTALSLILGVTLGLMTLTRTRWAEYLMRAVDVFQTFPLLILAIVVVVLAGNHLVNIIYAIAMINVPIFIRVVRSLGLEVRESRYVEAAIAVGGSPARVLLRHVIPNVSRGIVAQASITAAQSIMVIAAMTFLGIGVSPPTASWGAMIASGAQSIASGQWWPSVFPGLAVVAVVLSFNAIADGLHGDRNA
jgi:peptide/nickel transport system permease protein